MWEKTLNKEDGCHLSHDEACSLAVSTRWVTESWEICPFDRTFSRLVIVAIIIAIYNQGFIIIVAQTAILRVPTAGSQSHKMTGYGRGNNNEKFFTSGRQGRGGGYMVGLGEEGCYMGGIHSIAWYCMLLHGLAWYCMVLHVIAWSCMVLHGIT